MSDSFVTPWLLSSVQFSHSVMSNSLGLHGLQHARPPCTLPTPRVYSNSCPLNWWCHPTISSSVTLFSSCFQSFPVSSSFSMSQLFTSGLISFKMDLFDILAGQGTLKSLLQHYSSEASILQCSAFFMVQLSHLYMITGKAIALTIQTFAGRVMSLLLNMLSRF